MKKTILVFLLLLTLLSGACSKKASTTTSAEKTETKNLNLYSINKIVISHASADDLIDIDALPDYEKYRVDNTDIIDALAVSLDNLVKTKENPDNITYHARFYQEGLKPIDMWFGFPDKIWMKSFDGNLDCWAVDGEFPTLLAGELKNVPLKFKGTLGINGITKQPVLFVFNQAYNLVFETKEQDYQDLLGGTLEIIGFPYVSNSENYLRVANIKTIPSKSLIGELKPWLDGKSMALQTDSGETIVLQVTEGQRSIMQEDIGKIIKVIGATDTDESHKLHVYFYKAL